MDFILFPSFSNYLQAFYKPGPVISIENIPVNTTGKAPLVILQLHESLAPWGGHLKPWVFESMLNHIQAHGKSHGWWGVRHGDGMEQDGMYCISSNLARASR